MPLRVATIPNLNERRALQIALKGDWVSASTFANAFNPIGAGTLRKLVDKKWLEFRRNTDAGKLVYRITEAGVAALRARIE